jgi:hypothetical protein
VSHRAFAPLNPRGRWWPHLAYGAAIVPACSMSCSFASAFTDNRRLDHASCPQRLSKLSEGRYLCANQLLGADTQIADFTCGGERVDAIVLHAHKHAHRPDSVAVTRHRRLGPALGS